MSKSKSEKSSPLVQAALDASNPSGNSVGSSNYLPTNLATAINYSYYAPHHLKPSATTLGHTHLAANKQGTPSEGGVAPIGMFLGQSQPGFPSSCFRVKGHGGVATTTAPAPPASTAAVGGAVSSATSYTSCLGPDWPDLGVTLGQGAKAPGKMTPSVTNTGSVIGRGGASGAGAAVGGTGGAGSTGGYGTESGGDSSAIWKAASDSSSAPVTGQ